MTVRSPRATTLRPEDVMLAPLVLSACLQVQDPNVVIILADDLGVDRVGAYGDVEAHTPVLDGLAARGALFTQGYSDPVCSPTRAAILTGTYAHRWGITHVIDVSSEDPDGMLPLDAPSLPQALPPRYAKEAVGKWHLANESVGLTHPLIMGFDNHAGTKANPGDVFSFHWWENGVKVSLLPIEDYLLSYTVDRAIERIEAQTGPWVLYLALHAPHKPLHDPPPGLHTHALPLETPTQQFRAYVEAMDTEIGRLLEHVDLADTYVIFVGDNGTFVEAIDPGLDPLQSKGHVSEGGIHVPFLVAGPMIEPGLRTGLTHVVDIAPTVAALTGGDPRLFADGRDVSDALFVDPDAGRESIYWRLDGDVDEEALRVGRWKLVRRDAAELYDLRTDPGETTDLAALHPAIVARMLATMADIAATDAARAVTAERSSDPRR